MPVIFILRGILGVFLFWWYPYMDFQKMALRGVYGAFTL
nr:MAG TPA: hypothetical protein [Caudoviricetes sp.]